MILFLASHSSAKAWPAMKLAISQSRPKSARARTGCIASQQLHRVLDGIEAVGDKEEVYEVS